MTPGEAPKTGEKAMAPMMAKADLSVGAVTFEEIDGRVTMRGEFTGLKPGKHAITIHQATECRAKDGGAHFNPRGTKHGPPESAERHSGDFGNVEADKDGKAMFDMTTDSITLREGPDSIVGKTLAIHAKADDGKSQPNGKSGAVVSCAKIEATGDTPPATSSR